MGSQVKNAVIRVCPRDAPHGCNFSEDPKAEIGRVFDAWKEDNEVKARADITDSVASQKITDGTGRIPGVPIPKLLLSAMAEPAGYRPDRSHSSIILREEQQPGR